MGGPINMDSVGSEEERAPPRTENLCKKIFEKNLINHSFSDCEILKFVIRKKRKKEKKIRKNCISKKSTFQTLPSLYSNKIIA